MKYSLLLILVLYASCAFRSDPGEKEASQLPQGTVRISWWNEDRSHSPVLTRALQFRAEERLMSAASPVTLPVKPPEHLRIELSIPNVAAKPSPETLRIQWVLDGGAPMAVQPKHVQLASQSEEVSVLLVELGSLNSFLPTSGDWSGELRFLVQESSGEVKLTARVGLRLPPAQLEIKSQEVQASDLEGIKDGEALKSIELGRVRYSLVRVVHLKNSSGSVVQVEVPWRGEVALKLLRTRHLVTPTGSCSHQSKIERVKIGLANDPRIFVLDGSLRKRLTELPEDPAAPFATSAVIAPEQEVRLAIYFAGEAASAIAQGRYVMHKPESVSVASRCESHCDKMRLAGDEFRLCWRGVLAGGGDGRVSRRQIQDCLDCGSGSQPACESCRAWEDSAQLYRSAGPNCLFCGELVDLGRVLQPVAQWKWQPIMTEVASGDEDEALLVESDYDRATLRVRYADGPSDEVQEDRSVPFLRPYVGGKESKMITHVRQQGGNG